MTTAWAVVEYGDIRINSVGDTRRAALVNWLVAEKRVLALAHASDQLIEQMWSEHQGDAICTTVKIEVTKR